MVASSVSLSSSVSGAASSSASQMTTEELEKVCCGVSWCVILPQVSSLILLLDIFLVTVVVNSMSSLSLVTVGSPHILLYLLWSRTSGD